MQYIARQPIFDSGGRVKAYELLFRASAENRYTGTDPDLATMRTMDTAVLVGLDVLSDGRSIFLNCTRELLIESYPTLFPPELTVVEVLETVELDQEVLASCQRLKEAGYRLALDDYLDDPRYAPLVELADFIKVDFRATPPATRAALVARYSTPARKLLAEKVETREEFADAVRDGFALFQGYFFAKPSMLSTPKPKDTGAVQFRLLEILGQPALDFLRVEQVIKSEPALCYRLLRYLNSPAFYLQAEIKSVLHGLILLGEVEVRKWLLLVSAVMAGTPAKLELICSALTRARFAELLAPQIGQPGSLLFILALMSLMDAILDLPLPRILDQIVLPAEVRDALSGKPNELRQLHDLILAYESADWENCERRRIALQLPEYELRKAYLEALTWAKRVTET